MKPYIVIPLIIISILFGGFLEFSFPHQKEEESEQDKAKRIWLESLENIQECSEDSNEFFRDCITINSFLAHRYQQTHFMYQQCVERQKDYYNVCVGNNI